MLTQKQVEAYKRDGYLKAEGLFTPKEVEELEKVISEIKIDKNTFIKEALFEDLKKIFGSDVEVMIGE